MRYRKPSYMLLASLTLMLALSGPTASAQSRPAAPVEVINTTLPVTGTVAVSAIVAPVVIDTTTPLSVAGQVTVTDPGQAVYSARLYSSLEGDNVGAFIDLPEVPSGRRLVLEYVGLSCRSDPDDEFTVSVYVAAAGGAGWYAPIPVLSRSKNWFGTATMTNTAVLQTRLYSDGSESAPQVYYEHSKTTATVYCSGAVSGYTFPIQ